MKAGRVCDSRAGVIGLATLVAGLFFFHTTASAQNCPKTLGLQNRLVSRFLVAEDHPSPNGLDGGEVNANRPDKGAWETWTMVDVNCGEFGSGDDVILKAWNENYLHVMANGAVVTGGPATHFLLEMETGGPLRDRGVARLKVRGRNTYLHVLTGEQQGRVDMVQCSAEYEDGADRWTIDMPVGTGTEPTGGVRTAGSPLTRTGQVATSHPDIKISPGASVALRPATTAVWLATDRGNDKALFRQRLVYVETGGIQRKPNYTLSAKCIYESGLPRSSQLAMTGPFIMSNGLQVTFKTTVSTYVTAEYDGGDGLTVNRFQDNASSSFALVRVVVTPDPNSPGNFSYVADSRPDAAIQPGDLVALKSRNGHFWSFKVESSGGSTEFGSVNCTSDHIGPTEVFMIYMSRPNADVFSCPGG